LTAKESTDSVLKIHPDGSKLSEIKEIKDCLENADDNMLNALKSSPQKNG